MVAYQQEAEAMAVALEKRVLVLIGDLIACSILASFVTGCCTPSVTQCLPTGAH